MEPVAAEAYEQKNNALYRKGYCQNFLFVISIAQCAREKLGKRIRLVKRSVYRAEILHRKTFILLFDAPLRHRPKYALDVNSDPKNVAK
jgi:hypothetical protein